MDIRSADLNVNLDDGSFSENEPKNINLVRRFGLVLKI